MAESPKIPMLVALSGGRTVYLYSALFFRLLNASQVLAILSEPGRITGVILLSALDFPTYYPSALMMTLPYNSSP
jgi:hypothetical protein